MHPTDHDTGKWYSLALAAFLALTAFHCEDSGTASPSSTATEEPSSTATPASAATELEGTWSWTAGDGMFVFAGNTVTMDSSGTRFLEGTVALDTAASPKQMRVRATGPQGAPFVGLSLVAIYRVSPDGDTLAIAEGEPGNSTIPADFSPNKGFAVFQAARVKEIMPLREGSQFAYRGYVYSASGSIDDSTVLAFEVVKAVTITSSGGEEWFDIRSTVPGDPGIFPGVLANRTDGLWVHYDSISSRPYLLYRFPATTGAQYELDLRLDDGTPVTTSVRVVSTSARVTAPAGTFTCYHYENSIVRADSPDREYVDLLKKQRSEIYVSPGKGLIVQETYAPDPKTGVVSLYIKLVATDIHIVNGGSPKSRVATAKWGMHQPAPSYSTASPMPFDCLLFSGGMDRTGLR